MAVESVQVNVEANTYAFAQALAKFGVDLMAAIKAGGGTIPELAAIGTAVLADLVPVAFSVVQIPAELKDDKYAFAKAWELAGTDFVKAVFG